MHEGHFVIPIQIAGSHEKADVLEDSVLAWRLVKSGGLIIFDDYSYGKSVKHTKRFYCREAITYFAMCFDEKFEVVHNGQQLILKRKDK